MHFLSTITGSFAMPADENQTVAMVEAAYAHHGILDEPTRGIDVGSKAEIYQIMTDLANHGAAIIMISSELPEVLGMSDRVMVMRDGRIVKELARADASEEVVMQYAVGHEEAAR